MIPFLKRLFGFFGVSHERPDLLPPRVADPEPLTRFIFSDKYFAASVPRVKRQAFAPRKGETSVFRTMNLMDVDVWKIGRENVGEHRGQPPRGRADFTAMSVRQARLDIVAEPSLHPRHANIVGWHPEKERQRLAAMELAGHTTLVLPETAV